MSRFFNRAGAAAVFAAGAFLASTVLAAAMPSPQAQADMDRAHQARIRAAGVVVGRVLSVKPVPDDEEGVLFAACRLMLRIERVERGGGQVPGDTFRADIPCMGSRTGAAEKERWRRRVEAERQWRADHARENFWKGFRGEAALPWPPEWTTYTLDQLRKGRFVRLYLDADGTVAYGQYELLPKLPE